MGFLLHACLLLLLLLAALPCQAASVAGLVEKGNRAYVAGDFPGALAAYDEAAGLDPRAPAVQYNRGATLYRLGDLDGAAEAFGRASAAPDPALAGKSRFGQGGATFRKAEKALPADPKQGLRHLEEAAGHFEKAHELLPGDKASAENLEITRRKIREAREVLERQEQEARQAKDREEQRQQREARENEAARQEVDKLREEQKNLADETGERRESGEPADSGEEAQEARERQERLRQKTEALARDMRDGEAEKRLDEAAAEQKAAEQALEENRLDEAEARQRQAEKALEQAGRDLAEKDPGEKSPKDTPGAEESGKQENAGQKAARAQQPPEPTPSSSAKPGQGREDAAPPDESARDILNTEARTRRERRLESGAPDRPVDKDW